jgi:hypothetical protein
MLNQSGLFYCAGEEFAPSLKPCAVTGAMKNAMRCMTFALKTMLACPPVLWRVSPASVRRENDHAQIMLIGLIKMKIEIT